MPDSTSRYSLPFPLLRGDSPNGAQEIQDLATAVESALGVVDDRTVTHPAGDQSHSVKLTGADVRANQNTRTDILTTSWTLTHPQIVCFAAKAMFVADATANATGTVGMVVQVDGSVGGSLDSSYGQAGPIHISPQLPSYTITGASTDRTYNAGSTSVAELANVLSTLIGDLAAGFDPTRDTLVIPMFGMLLAAGSHTAILSVDRSNDGVINVKGDAALPGRTYDSTTLTVII